jgi:hypothetical protein
MLTWLEKMRGPVAPARLQALKDAKLMEAVTQVGERSEGGVRRGEVRWGEVLEWR